MSLIVTFVLQFYSLCFSVQCMGKLLYVGPFIQDIFKKIL